jgi:hypothetical protein
MITLSQTNQEVPKHVFWNTYNILALAIEEKRFDVLYLARELRDWRTYGFNLGLALELGWADECGRLASDVVTTLQGILGGEGLRELHLLPNAVAIVCK